MNETLEQIALRVLAEIDPDGRYFPYQEDTLEFSRRLVAEIGKQEPVAEVVWYDPVLAIEPEKAGKIIDGSMAFIQSAPLGTKLYLHPIPTPEEVKDAAKWREHEAKKKALIERGFLKSPLRDAAELGTQGEEK